ncbi:MAG TPA: PAS domain-containing sensor histidine kinase [Burkholderiaceae bacterium]|nr:PAS domain-containing sensor histidine kinase [Burkholderiaceae bacterium]
MADDDRTAPEDEGQVDRWLRLLLEQTRDYAVILTRTEGTITAWFHGAEHLFGHSRDEAVGQHFGLIFSPEDRRAGVPTHELGTAAIVGRAQDDRWHQRKDGSMFWGSGATFPVQDAAGRLLGFGKIVRDRTDLRTQFETLQHRLRLETEARRRQDLALATLVHELRNPLAPLRTALQVLQRVAPGQGQLQPPLKIIERQTAALQRLLDDMMDSVQLKAGKLRLAMQDSSLPQELEVAMAAVQAAAKAKGIEIKPVLPAFDIRFEVDRDRFQQVVVNLLDNAIKFTPRGGTVWVKADISNAQAVVRIEDTGCGIPPEAQPWIFRLFTQGPHTPTGRTGGLGLGLALVKSLVEVHGGTVSVRSEGLGKGSEFTVRLPLVQGQGAV